MSFVFFFVFGLAYYLIEDVHFTSAVIMYAILFWNYTHNSEKVKSH